MLSVILFIANQPIKTGVRFISTPDNIQVRGSDYSFRVSFDDVVSIRPGSYTFSVSKDGYNSTDISVVVTENTVSSVCISLEPQTDAARKDLASTKDISARQEAVGGCNIETGAKVIETEYPFVNKLPIIDKYFSATSCQDDTNTTIICVTLTIDTEAQKQRALSIIKQKGIDTDSTLVRFIENGDD